MSKLIRVKDKTHEILRLEAARRSMKPNCVSSTGSVVDGYAAKLNGRRRFLKGK